MNNKGTKPPVTAEDINKIMILDDVIPEYIQNDIYDDVFKRQSIPYFFQNELSGLKGDNQYGFGLNMFLNDDLCNTKTNQFFKYVSQSRSVCIPFLVLLKLGIEGWRKILDIKILFKIKFRWLATK